MAKYDGPLEDMSDICIHCDYLRQYLDGNVTVEMARENCALRCKQHDNQRKGIYKFDIVYSLYCEKVGEDKPKFSGKGRVSKAEERYGKAVRMLKSDGKNISQIASILGISRPTVYKLIGGDNL